MAGLGYLLLALALSACAFAAVSCSSDDADRPSATATPQPPAPVRAPEPTTTPTVAPTDSAAAPLSPTPRVTASPTPTSTAEPTAKPSPAADRRPVATPTAAAGESASATPAATPAATPTPSPTPEAVATPAPDVAKLVRPIPEPRPLVPWELTGQTPLHRAVLEGSLEAVRSMVDEGVDLETQAGIAFPGDAPQPGSPLYQWSDLNYTVTPLHLAAWSGEPAMVELLLDSGADVDARGGEWNALYFALAHNPNPAVAELLLDRGSSLNPTGSATETPLHQAARFNTNPSVVELLLDREEVPVDARSNYGGTPLHQTARHNPNHEVVEMLLERGADVNSGRHSGYTPLHMAAYNPNPLVASALLAAGASVEGLDNDVPQTPLSLASYNFEPGVAEVILDGGADIDAHDGLPLRNAVGRVNLGVTALLLDRGAEIGGQARGLGGNGTARGRLEHRPPGPGTGTDRGQRTGDIRAAARPWCGPRGPGEPIHAFREADLLGTSRVFRVRHRVKGAAGPENRTERNKRVWTNSTQRGPVCIECGGYPTAAGRGCRCRCRGCLRKHPAARRRELRRRRIP